MRRAAVLLVLVLALAGCTTKPSSPGAAADDRADKSSLACDHFRNVMKDGSQGILTDDELRAKLKEVNDDAIIATPAVQAAATEMLRSKTAGVDSEFAAAITSMDAACDAAGHAN